MIALSSGESELYATLKAAAEALGILSMLSDLGWKMRGEVWGDANVALGIINRRGLGKTRHIDTGNLWIQEVAAKGRLKFNKVLGKDNPADLYTKYLDEKTCEHHVTNLAFKFKDGRAGEAPKLHLLSQSRAECEGEADFQECEWVAKIIQTVSNAWEGKKQRGRASHESKDQKPKELSNCIRRSTTEWTLEKHVNLLQHQDNEVPRSTTVGWQNTLRGTRMDYSRTNVKQEGIK